MRGGGIEKWEKFKGETALEPDHLSPLQALPRPSLSLSEPQVLCWKTTNCVHTLLLEDITLVNLFMLHKCGPMMV